MHPQGQEVQGAHDLPGKFARDHTSPPPLSPPRPSIATQQGRQRRERTRPEIGTRTREARNNTGYCNLLKDSSEPKVHLREPAAELGDKFLKGEKLVNETPSSKRNAARAAARPHHFSFGGPSGAFCFRSRSCITSKSFK